MTRRLRVYGSVGVLYNTYVWDVTAVRMPEVANSYPTVGHNFYLFFLQENSIEEKHFPCIKLPIVGNIQKVLSLLVHLDF